MRLALYQPDIAGNVGTILRLSTCLLLEVGVDLIEPMDSAWGDCALARAGMDYLDTADVTRHVDWEAFAAQAPGRIVLLTTRGGVRIDEAEFRADDVLLLGSESAGVPSDVHARADLIQSSPHRVARSVANFGFSRTLAAF